MIVDIDGNVLVQGDVILICNAKDYGWLNRYLIIGENATQFKLKRMIPTDTAWPIEMKIEKKGCS